MDKKYKIIDHTADFGVQVFGKDRLELFNNAAFALFDLITDVSSIKSRKEKSVVVDGKDWPDLMVNWLRELLYLWSGEELLVGAVRIQKIEPHEIIADLFCEPYDPSRHPIKIEIKAVTYHQIEVAQTSHGWEARFIVDV